jgi:hypothetical protein
MAPPVLQILKISTLGYTLISHSYLFEICLQLSHHIHLLATLKYRHHGIKVSWVQ